MSNIKREQCYQFKKYKTLKTSVQFFPEVIGKLSLSDNDTILSSIDLANKKNLSPQEPGAFLARLRGPIVLSFEQGKVVNMVRYRNILRYQLGLTTLNEPIIIDYTIGTNSTSNNSTLSRQNNNSRQQTIKTNKNNKLVRKGNKKKSTTTRAASADIKTSSNKRSTTLVVSNIRRIEQQPATQRKKPTVSDQQTVPTNVMDQHHDLHHQSHNEHQYHENYEIDYKSSHNERTGDRKFSNDSAMASAA